MSKEIEYFIAWWNLENLFDVKDMEDRARKLQNNTEEKDLKGWTDAALQVKIENLSNIIKKMNDGKGPDLLGVCEIEDEKVLQKLVSAIKVAGREYAIVHHDSPDPRGIDVAFIYDKKKFGFYVKDTGLYIEGSEPVQDTSKYKFSYEVRKRTATRDIFQVNFCTIKGENPLIVIGNHWPARSAGVYESEPYRVIAAETLAYWNSRIQEVLGKKVAILIMGDFNDGPLDRSVRDYALSTVSRKLVERSRIPRTLNLMLPLVGKGIGSYYWKNAPLMFDQFMISRGLFPDNDGLGYIENSVNVFRPDEMITGHYDAPKRFGLKLQKPPEKNGYSDHFPIYLRLVEEVANSDV